MEHVKKYTAKEAAIAVLKKAEEMLKAHKLTNLAKSELNATPPDGVQKDPNPAAPDAHENGNPAPGAMPQNKQPYAAELKGHLKLAKFMGHIESKRKKPAAPMEKAVGDKMEDGKVVLREAQPGKAGSAIPPKPAQGK